MLLSDKKTSFKVIAAMSINRVIGCRQQLPWHIPEELKWFKQVTLNQTLLMGRKTFESLGRPLPNRQNVVISRTTTQIEGCTVVDSLEAAIALFPKEEEIFIIGGAQIYALALEIADKFYLTRVGHSYEGDTSFPEWDASKWQLISRENYECGEKYPHPFAFEEYIRK